MTADAADLQFLARVRAGDTRALARAITLVERGGPAARGLVAAAYRVAGSAQVTGFTGPPGAGKSTLLGALTRHLRRRGEGERVAVLSVDPTSPFTRGALLGDRLRLVEHFEDDGVFIRSLATRGALGGLSAAISPAIVLADAAGYEHVLVETVGVGQSEIDVLDHVETVVLVLMPGSGDAVQAIKAGVMEIPDVVVVNKADDPRALDMARELRRLARPNAHDGRRIPVVTTEALSGEGVGQLAAAIAEHHAHLREAGEAEVRRRRRLARAAVVAATAEVRDAVEAQLAGDAGSTLLQAMADGELDPSAAANELLARWRG